MELKDNVQSSPLHVRTPLIYSAPLSKLAERPVYLKLENTQPSGSFKLRGIGNSCQIAVKNGATHLICSSGGNAGMATAYAAKRLGVRATVFTMDGLPQPVLKKFHELGCQIYIGGPIWDICDKTARQHMAELQQKGENVHYIHPFDSPSVWSGHSTLIHEVREQLDGCKPGAIVTCVGGGGLLAGIALGLRAVGWDDIPIIAMETIGAHSYYEALKEGKPVKLDAVTSIAKTLGAQQVCQEVVHDAKRHTILSRLTDDKTAVHCTWLMLRDHQMLVEPACGATLSPIYQGKLKEYLGDGGDTPIVAVVCGGATVDISTLHGLLAQFEVRTELEESYQLLEFNTKAASNDHDDVTASNDHDDVTESNNHDGIAQS